MSKERKSIKQNKRLLAQKMAQKFKTSFNVVIIGFVVVVVLAVLNIMIYANLAGVGVFSTFSRAVGMILLIGAVLLCVGLIRVVSMSLTEAIVKC